jgi:hypothetical protein
MTRRIVACAGLALAVAGAVRATPATAAPRHDVQAARADWSAGPVRQGTGYTRQYGSRRVREVQRRLRRLGYRPGPVDGLFGPRTQRATVRFQQRSGLVVDAVVGPRTLRALRTRDDARLAARRGRVRSTHPPAPEAQAPPPRTPAADGDGSGLLVVPLALAAAGLLAGGLVLGLERRRRRPLAMRADEIVAASQVRELAALAEAGLPPRWSRSAAERPRLSVREPSP